MYKILFTKQAQKDAKKIANLQGFYSRRINIKHRLVYEVFDKEKIVRILRM